MERKLPGMAPNGAGKVFFLPDLVDVLGDMDLDFENFHFEICLDSNFLDFQVPRFPNLARAGPGLGLGLGRPSGAPRVFPRAGLGKSSSGERLATRAAGAHLQLFNL